MNLPVVVVGGGVAGLSCARHLQRGGVASVVLEASDGVGGRVRTDRVDGFQLDRGFQILLTAYPEARDLLDYEALELRPFRPGALVRLGGRFERVGDPFRRPLDALPTLLSRVGTLRDKLLVLRLRRKGLGGFEGRTIDGLRGFGFSERMIERFYRPLFGGVFLERELATSAAHFEFTFRMFGEGDSVLPAAGMGAIPQQLAAGLAVRLNSPVVSVAADHVVLESGERVDGRSVVVATEAPAAARLLGEPEPPAGRSVTCHYFAAREPPVRDAVIMLNGDGEGPVNDVTVLSEVASTYAPAGQALVCANVIGDRPDADVLAPLQAWFGDRVREWRRLRTYTIRHALPIAAERPPRTERGVYVCGDHCASPSLNGAMLSGRRVAEAILGSD
jgi:phytoene dehydrogenase-like protein